MDTVLRVDFSEKEKQLIRPNRGDIYFANIEDTNGKKTVIQKGKRPLIVTSCKDTNDSADFVNYVAFSSQIDKVHLPTHIRVGTDCGLKMPSYAICEQTMSIDKSDLIFKIGRCTEEVMNKIDNALTNQLGLNNKKEVEEEMPIEKSKSIIKQRRDKKINDLAVQINMLNEVIYIFKIDPIETAQIRDMKLKELEEFCKANDGDFGFAMAKIKKY